MKKLAVVLFNLGGPDSPDAVQPFLFNLFNDPAIIRLPNPFRYLLAKVIAKRRAPLAKEIYKTIGGKSPLLENTMAQAHALEDKLNADDDLYKSFIAMRYWKPFSSETVKEVQDFGPDEIVLVPLYPQYSTTTTQSSLDDWQMACDRVGLSVPTRTIRSFPENEAMVAAYVDLAKPLMEQALACHKNVHLLLSAHGLPEKIVKAGDIYPTHVEQTAALIVRGLEKALGRTDLKSSLCYQSRVGPMTWIGPSTEKLIVEAGKKNEALVVLPVSFVSEHSETLVELDVEYKQLADQNGVPAYLRVPALGTHPSFIEGLADMIKEPANHSGTGHKHD